MNEVDNYAKFLCDHEHVIDVDQEKSHHRLARYTPNFQTEKQLESAVRRLNAFEKKARFFELIRSWASLKHEYRENAARKRLVLTLPAHSNVLLKRQGHSGSTQHPAPSTQHSAVETRPMTLGLSAAVTAALDRAESMAVEWVAEATRRRPKGLESADGGENGRETA